MMVNVSNKERGEEWGGGRQRRSNLNVSWSTQIYVPSPQPISHHQTFGAGRRPSIARRRPCKQPMTFSHKKGEGIDIK